MISKTFPTSRRSARPRRFLEEVPSIDIDAALRTGTPGSVDVIWEDASRHNDKPFGQGVLSVVELETATHIHLQYNFSDDPDDVRNELFASDYTRNGITGSRLRVVCPECKSLRSALYLCNDLWKCRTCHGLLYRTKYGADVEPDHQLHDRLMAMSRRPRRPYERASVYQREVQKALAKLERLGPMNEARRDARELATIVATYQRGYELD